MKEKIKPVTTKYFEPETLSVTRLFKLWFIRKFFQYGDFVNEFEFKELLRLLLRHRIGMWFLKLRSLRRKD